MLGEWKLLDPRPRTDCESQHAHAPCFGMLPRFWRAMVYKIERLLNIDSLGSG